MQGTVSGWIAQLIIRALTAGGYLGLCGLMAIESASIPLPSEIILPFAGFLVSQDGFGWRRWQSRSIPGLVADDASTLRIQDQAAPPPGAGQSPPDPPSA